MSERPTDVVHYVWGITALAVATTIGYRLFAREDFRDELKRAGLDKI